MAYTDTFLPLVVPFQILEAVTGSRIIAFNVLQLVSWVLCAEATFRLARRFVRDDRAAAVGAVAFTFSTVRLSAVHHFQLAWAGFIPLGFLLLFRFRDRPTPARGAALAAVLVVQLLTSAYYGVVLIVGAGAIVAVGAVGHLRARTWRPALAGHLVLGGLTVGALLPIRHWYASAEACALDRQFGNIALGGLRPGNLLSVSSRSVLLADVPVLGSASLARTHENHAYVGSVVLIATVIGAVWIVRHRRMPAWLHHPQQLVAIGVVGVATAAVALGPLDHGFPMPYDLATALIPGVDSMGALGRLTIFLQLPLALVVTVVLAGWFEQRQGPAPLLVSGALVAVMVLEGLVHQPMLRPATPSDDSVYSVLADLDGGVAVELPMPPRSTVGIFAFVESTRMALGSGDDFRTVNGYSGYVPALHDLTVDTFNTFPSPKSIRATRSLGVDVVVIHTRPPDAGQQPVSALLARTDSFAYLPPGEAEALVDDIPAGVVARRIDARDGIVLVLEPGPDVGVAPACDGRL